MTNTTNKAIERFCKESDRPKSYTDWRKHGDEEAIMSRVRDVFPSLSFKWSSWDNDVYDDIDCYLAGVPLSIKRMDKAIETGNLSFELDVLHRDYGWQKSTFYNTAAQRYVVAIGKSVYLVNVESLKSLIETRGWDRTVTLSPQALRVQKNIGHCHVDARCGLIKLTTLIRAGVAKRVVPVARPIKRVQV